jgi:hypothetical protein
MKVPENKTNGHHISLPAALVNWAACLFVLILLITVAITYEIKVLADVAFYFYFVAGLFLSRSVFRRIIQWHPMYNTLYNVTSTKLKFFFLWPITYLFLFIRLGINKAL